MYVHKVYKIKSVIKSYINVVPYKWYNYGETYNYLANEYKNIIGK